ncbi:reverse transcriptase domain-containing protein [Tanacetum coccineum]
MNIPITFPPILIDDVFCEPLIVDVEVERHMVRRLFVDQGAAVQVMFKHCFDKLCPSIKARLTETQTELVGFFSAELIPIDDHYWEEVLYEMQITIDKFPKKEHGCIRMAPSDMTGVPKQNVGSMYQRQVDTAFQSQLGRNLESYVDDIVIKSKTKQEMMMDITKTFDYLRQINMKLNPKKCLLRVEEGKFLGYMVTSEGIRENIKRTKAVLYMQSSRTPKEMQSLSGHCEWGIISRKKLKANNHPIRQPNFHEAERNYAPLEKLTLCLLHLSRRLRRYFEAHPTRVITDQPVKQILNKPEVFGKLAKYAVELGAYDIMYVPQNAVKGHVLEDFLNETPTDTEKIEKCNLSDGTNNEVEYEALLARLRISQQMKVHALNAKVDLNLVAS